MLRVINSIVIISLAVLIVCFCSSSVAEGEDMTKKKLTIPELLIANDGTHITNIETWQVRKEEILQLLSENIYGHLPLTISSAKGEIFETIKKCCSGHAVLERITITVETEKGEFSFPMSLILPKNEGKETVPLILLLNFRPDIYDMYIPTEEIIDHGFGLGIIYYEDIVPDDDYEKDEKVESEWDEGLAACFTRATDGTGFGKISLWAWGASRCMDYLMTREDIDHDHIAIAGHSRLGKAALWCAANDERFFCAISNDSGCAGAAIERNHHDGAETIKDILRFDSWFCENYSQYADSVDSMPFDQHYLLAAIAPRLVAIGSASEDAWADPENELMSCILASPVWALFGEEGYVGQTDNIQSGDIFSDGKISYHLRDGIHYLGRSDWLVYLEFLERNMQQ